MFNQHLCTICKADWHRANVCNEYPSHYPRDEPTNYSNIRDLLPSPSRWNVTRTPSPVQRSRSPAMDNIRTQSPLSPRFRLRSDSSPLMEAAETTLSFMSSQNEFYGYQNNPIVIEETQPIFKPFKRTNYRIVRDGGYKLKGVGMPKNQLRIFKKMQKQCSKLSRQQLINCVLDQAVKRIKWTNNTARQLESFVQHTNNKTMFLQRKTDYIQFKSDNLIDKIKTQEKLIESLENIIKLHQIVPVYQPIQQ